MTYFDQEIKHQVGLIRVEAYESRRIKKILSAADKEVERLLRDIERMPGPNTKAFQTLTTRVVKIRRKALAEVRSILVLELHQLVDFENNFELRALRSVLEKVNDVDIGILRKKALSTPFQTSPGQMSNMDGWMDAFERADIRRVEDALLAAAQTKRKANALLIGTRGNRFKDGLLRRTHTNADALIRTAFTHVSATVRGSIWAANHTTRLLRWTAILDRKTCPICISLHGRYTTADGSPLPARYASLALTPSTLQPPLHGNCRCALVPVLDAANDEAPTANEWLRGLPANEQNQLLGVGRAKLFRSGKIDAESLTNQTGREIPLAELI